MDIPSLLDHHPQPVINPPSTDPSNPQSHPSRPISPDPSQTPVTPQNSSDPSPPPPPSSSTQTTTIDASLDPTPKSPITQSYPTPLEQEIQDLKKTLGGVGASLGGWWGKVQKQSLEALTTSNLTAQLNTARKDLASLNLIEKAKKEVERLGEQAKEGYTFISTEIENVPHPDSNQGRIVNVDGVELPPPSRSISTSSTITPTSENQPPISPKGKERAEDQDQPDQPQDQSIKSPLSAFDSAGFGSFFNKLTKDGESFTTTLQSKISHLPNPVQVVHQTGLTNAAKFDLSQVQKLAGGYLAKGEVYLQDVGKELKDFVQEAVKVIPPPDQDHPSSDHPNDPNQSSLSNTVIEKRRLLDLKRESMVSNLRRDASFLLLDPRSEDSNLQSSFDHFLSSIEQAGGLEGEAWQKRIELELECDEPDRSALKSLVEQLVPSSMTRETFWTRYLFRIYRIDQEEAARRVVLSAAQEDNDGDFSWDMEDESEPASPVVVVNPSKKAFGHEIRISETDKEEQVETPKLSQLSQPTVPASKADGTEKVGSRSPPNPAPSNTSLPSRRNSSSEGDTVESFDVVSAQQSSDEKPKERSEEVVAQGSTKSQDHQDADEDSDWE